MSHRILAINPGSTSTKFAVYDDNTPIFTRSIHHSPDELAGFGHLSEQFAWRKGLIEKALEDNGIPLRSLSAVIGRGGIICPVESGTYEVNDELRRCAADEANLSTAGSASLGREGPLSGIRGMLKSLLPNDSHSGMSTAA